MEMVFALTVLMITLAIVPWDSPVPAVKQVGTHFAFLGCTRVYFPAFPSQVVKKCKANARNSSVFKRDEQLILSVCFFHLQTLMTAHQYRAEMVHASMVLTITHVPALPDSQACIAKQVRKVSFCSQLIILVVCSIHINTVKTLTCYDLTLGTEIYSKCQHQNNSIAYTSR